MECSFPTYTAANITERVPEGAKQERDPRWNQLLKKFSFLEEVDLQDLTPSDEKDWTILDSNPFFWEMVAQKLNIELKKQTLEDQKKQTPQPIGLSYQDQIQRIIQARNFSSTCPDNHRSFLYTILTGSFNKEFVESFKNFYLKDYSIDIWELGNLLATFAHVFLSVNNQKKSKLVNEFINALDATDKLTHIKDCLALEYTAKEFNQILRNTPEFHLTSNVWLKLTEMGPNLDTLVRETSGEISQNSILNVFKHIARLNGKEVQFSSDKYELTINYKINQEQQLFSIKFDANYGIRLIPAKKISLSLTNVLQQIVAQKIDKFILPPATEIIFTDILRPDLKRIKLANKKDIPQILLGIINNKILQQIGEFKHVLLITNGQTEVMKVQQTKRKLTFTISKGAVVQFDTPCTYTEKTDNQAEPKTETRFMSGLLMIDGPIDFFDKI
jgi:hypothetical protein